MIEKFKNIEHSTEPIYSEKIDTNYFRKVNEFFKMIEKLSDFKVKRGIQKFGKKGLGRGAKVNS